MMLPSYKKYTSFVASLLLLSILLPSCTQDPYFEKAPTYIAYKDAPASILNRGYISGTSMRTLAKMRFHHIKVPTTREQRIAYAEREIFRAKNILDISKKSAASHYLKAAETLWPVVKNTQYPREKAYWGEKKRLLIAHQLYTHAVGQAARHIASSHLTSPNQKSVTLDGVTLTINTQSPHTIHPSFFDHINPVDTYIYRNVGPHHYKTYGLGAAANGHRNRTASRVKANPLMPPYGMDIPINVIIDYPKPGHPRLTLTNLLKTNTTQITGNTRPLSGDYSATIAALMDSQSSFLGLMIAMNPKKYQEDTGLFAIGPFDPDKIPVIFIHGLISQPSTWTQASNYLLQDKTIRENYQFYYYFYPTGVTPVLTGSNLRKTLLAFYKSHHASSNSNLNHTVLIGHSMGGLLSSIQSRKFDNKLLNKLFKSPGNKQEASSNKSNKDDMLKKYAVLFNPPALRPIERTVFICTPHLGSEIANGWIGAIGSSLIKIPKSMMTLQLGASLNSLTDFGRTLLTQNGPPNSVNRLKPNNPSLKLLAKQPFNERVTYHSIIGDRGKGDTPNSSDGVVPYWSSHIKGAASEKIVPTNHESLNNEETHKEIKRILYLHLKKVKQGN